MHEDPLITTINLFICNSHHSYTTQYGKNNLWYYHLYYMHTGA